MSKLWADLRGDIYGKAIAAGQKVPPAPLRLKDLQPKLPEKPRARRKVSEAMRWAIWERDDFTCQKCGSRRYLVIDHIVPWSRGGSCDHWNLQTLCKTCNSKKHDKYEL